MKRVAIYLRVSTSKQDTDNQRRELEAVAKRSGWEAVKVYQDAGISGAKGSDKRPGLDAMMKAVNAKEFDMVASWSVDQVVPPDEHLRFAFRAMFTRTNFLDLGQWWCRS